MASCRGVPIRPITVLLALVVGAAAVAVGLQWQRRHAIAGALARIASDDAERRREAWAFLLPRVDRLGERIDEALGSVVVADARSGDADRRASILRDAVAALESARAWSWTARRTDLVAAGDAARLLFGDDAERRAALAHLAAAPGHLAASSTVTPVVRGLAEGLDDRDPAAATRRADLAEWIPDLLDVVVVRHGNLDDARGPAEARRPGVRDLLENATLLGPEPGRRAALLLAALGIPCDDDPDADPRVRAARLLALVRSSSEVPGSIAALASADRIPRVTLLRAVPEPAAAAAFALLERIAASAAPDARTASFAVAARRERRGDDGGSERERLRRIVLDEDRPVPVRMLAAWRGAGPAVPTDGVAPESVADPSVPAAPAIPAGLIRTLLDRDLASDAPRPWAAALLAERTLPPAELDALAADWRRSLDEDRRAAAALLDLRRGDAEALDEHARRLEREDDGRLRTVLRLVVEAAGRRPADEPARRAFALSAAATGPDLAAAAALALVAADDPLGLVLATRLPADLPDDDLAVEAGWRTWLIAADAPHLLEPAGRPIGGDPDGLRLHFDFLDALRTASGGPAAVRAGLLRPHRQARPRAE